MDNIKLNQISPLLSSTEKIKAVDRRPRHSQQPPFKSAQQDKQKKKKKKKKHGEDGALSEVIDPMDSPHFAKQAVKSPPEKKTDAKAGQRKRIIDIRI